MHFDAVRRRSPSHCKFLQPVDNFDLFLYTFLSCILLSKMISAGMSPNQVQDGKKEESES